VPGSITIAKETNPDGGTGFEFLGEGFPGGCNLDDFTLDDDDSESCDGLEPGVYVVQEVDLPSGWQLTDIDCDGEGVVIGTIGFDGEVEVFEPGQTEGFDSDDDAVQIRLSEGDAVTCTFTNTGPTPTPTFTSTPTSTVRPRTATPTSTPVTPSPTATNTPGGAPGGVVVPPTNTPTGAVQPRVLPRTGGGEGGSATLWMAVAGAGFVAILAGAVTLELRQRGRRP
jgi:hypothetical protein